MKIIKGNHCNHAISPHLKQLAIVHGVYFTALKLMCHAKLCWDRFEENCYFDFVHRSVSAPDITCNNKTFKVQTVVDTVLHNTNSTLPPGNSGKMRVYFDTK